ncbi:MAG TPA: hypothetical protein VGL20_11690 [Candidatus Dormibacteraeota bacterium]
MHRIEPGTILDGAGTQLRRLHPSGAVLEDFGSLPQRPGGEPLMPGNVVHHPPGAAAARTVPAFGSGWITYASWTNDTGTPVSNFTTTWVVPPAPSTRSGQTIFLFNGIQNSTMIYQPVLQWGASAAGGGDYWAVASWYVDGAGGPAFHSDLVAVNPGDVLVGVMSLTGQSPTGFSYNSEFQGIANTGLPISNVEQLTWCIQTLEVYGITQPSDYPAVQGTAMRAIGLQTGGTTPALTWTVNDAVSDIGQCTEVISNAAAGGEVDLCYTSAGLGVPPGVAAVNGTVYMAWKGIQQDDGIWWSTFDGASWAAQQNVGGVATSGGPSLALFGGTLYAVWKGMVDDQGIYWSSFDGAAWAPQQNIAGVGTSVGPSLVVFNDRLYAAWKGVWGDQGIYWSSFDGANWAPQQNIAGVGTGVGPSLAVFNNKLYAAWKGINGDQGIYWSSFDGASWAPQQNVGGVATDHRPALAVFNNLLYAAWKGMSGDEGIYWSSFDGANWAPQQNVGGVATSVGPSLVTFGPALLASWKGLSGDDGIYWSSFDGASWAPQQNVAGVGTSPDVL